MWLDLTTFKEWKYQDEISKLSLIHLLLIEWFIHHWLPLVSLTEEITYLNLPHFNFTLGLDENESLAQTPMAGRIQHLGEGIVSVNVTPRFSPVTSHCYLHLVEMTRM